MSIRELIEKERAWRKELDDQLATHSRKLMQARREAHEKIIRAVAEQAGLDLDAILKEVDRRHAVERREVDRHVAKLQEELTKRRSKEREKFERAVAIYEEISGDAYKARFSNPWLVMLTPEEWWAEILTRGEGTVEATADFYTVDGVVQSLHPYCHADVGRRQRESNLAMTTQHLIYRHPPPEENYFLVNRVFVPVIAIGGYVGFRGMEPCVQLVGELVGRGVALEIGVSITQELVGREWDLFPPWRAGAVGEVLYQADHGPGAVGFGEGALIEGENIWIHACLESIPAAISGYPLLLFGPQAGGGDVIAHIELRCYAGAFYRHEFASISFERSRDCLISVGVGLRGD